MPWFVVLFLACISCTAHAEQTFTDNQYHEQIRQLWNQKKVQYVKFVKNSGEEPNNLYVIQAQTNNLLKYAGYCQKYALLDELCGLYLQSLETLTESDRYLYLYYPGSPRLSVHPLDKKYRMWVDKQKPVGQEIILYSAQFLYLLSDTVRIIADIKKDKRTPIMKEALNKFIPLLIEHYDRWIYGTPGPFQVRGWSCRFDGKYVPAAMNHQEFITKKLVNRLGNGESPAYCNAVDDTDMWILAGVANVLAVYKKHQDLVSITPEEYKKLLIYVKTGTKLLESRFSYTKLKNFDGMPVVGAVFEAGARDESSGYAFARYNGQEFPKNPSTDKSRYRGKNVGWDLSHARRFVHVFDTLMKSKESLGLEFPTKELLGKMANQLVYGTFNRDFQKPLFTNFMDGTNGWYRVDNSGQSGFGYGPWDMSLYVFEGGYGFWSIYNDDLKRIFLGFLDMLDSKDPAIRKHIIEHYETNCWRQYKRSRDFGYQDGDEENRHTRSLFIQMLPSMCFMTR